MNDRPLFRPVHYLILFLFLLFSIVVTLFPWNILEHLEFGGYKIHIHDYNELGDFVGGITSPVLSLMGVVLLYLTYLSQRRELENTRTEMRSQRANTSLFSMIGILDGMMSRLSEIRISVESSMMLEGAIGTLETPVRGREAMVVHAERLRQIPFTPNRGYEYNMETFGFDEMLITLESINILESTAETKSTPSGITITVDQYVDLIRPALRSYFQNQGNSAMNVLLYIEAIADFIVREFDSVENRIFFGRTFAAQFYSEELLVVFYYSLSGLSRRNDLNQRLTMMEFFDNISDNDWVTLEHRGIYRHRIFRLSAAEVLV